MSRLFDFQCDTCERVTERLIDGDEHEVPCDRTACGGTMARKIGGGPVPRGARASGLPASAQHVAHLHVGPYCLDVYVAPPPPKAKA